ncbi:MAG: hypothetical protein ACO3LT_08070 [Ilumatobacteraceae bacterium]
MAKNVVFDEDSAARIAAAVKWVEQYSLDETQDPEEPLPPDSDKPETVCRELSLVEASGNLTLLSQINPTGTVVQSLSGTVVQSLSGVVVTGVACVNGNLTVTTASLDSLSTSGSLDSLATSASLASLVGYTEQTVRLSDLATVITQNITLPKQEGCS